jgi:general secretion pathway protein G
MSGTGLIPTSTERKGEKKMSKKSGFTLVELIIVIIILGILAALAIPMFSSSSQDAKISTLKGDLAVLRNAVNLYYHEHNTVYPGAVKTDGTETATAAGDLPAAFVNQLTQYTDKTGKTSATKDAAYPYGPYLSSFPANPLPVGAIDGTLVSVTTDATTLTADATPTTAWKYSKVTGQIIGNNVTYQAL